MLQHITGTRQHIPATSHMLSLGDKGLEERFDKRFQQQAATGSHLLCSAAGTGLEQGIVQDPDTDSYQLLYLNLPPLFSTAVDLYLPGWHDSSNGAASAPGLWESESTAGEDKGGALQRYPCLTLQGFYTRMWVWTSQCLPCFSTNQKLLKIVKN